jgi:hypothetical protein
MDLYLELDKIIKRQVMAHIKGLRCKMWIFFLLVVICRSTVSSTRYEQYKI